LNPLEILSSRAVRALLAAVAAILAAAAPAGAQIYTWRDEKGVLTLSDHPRTDAGPVETYAVPATDAVRTTRSVATTGVRTFDDLIVEHARRNSIRADLVRAVVQVESAYNPYAVSPKGAQGLMQLMPATARRFGVVNAFDPEQNIRAGVAYLRELLDRYGNDEQLALAAYNAGPGAVDRYGETVPPYRETQNYVSKIGKIAGARKLPGTQIYETIEITPDGRAVHRYTDQKPK
jgi:soluble lytic murein transglycosylase-like protein